MFHVEHSAFASIGGDLAGFEKTQEGLRAKGLNGAEQALTTVCIQFGGEVIDQQNGASSLPLSQQFGLCQQQACRDQFLFAS